MVISFGVNWILGLSGDTKPTNVPTNSIFLETDTRNQFLFNGSTYDQLTSSTDDVIGLILALGG